MRRLPDGGRIGRGRPLRFVWDGRELTGFEGDTLASALLGAGVDVIGTSAALKRPRGITSAGFAPGPSSRHGIRRSSSSPRCVCCRDAIGSSSC